MEIYVDRKRAVLKKGTSFEFVSENRMFSGSDSYTLTITFPLRGCRDNLKIFGNINRKDVIAGRVRFDCEIRDGSFYKFGTITITEISDSEVKTQFLEGRSEQNFDETLDKYYINELNLGGPPSTSLNSFTPERAWDAYPNYINPECVALPWVNDNTGNIQNLADFVLDDASQNKGHYEWNTKKCTGLAWQPYLIFITKKICEAIGYTYDFTKWEASEEYKYLLICNTLPFPWYMPGFANALPHWTVEEYFEKLELFLGGEFDFDHRTQHINFAFTYATVADRTPVSIDKVLDEHSTEVSMEDRKCDYREMKNLFYKECDHRMWKYYSCQWFIDGWKNNIVKYDSLREMLPALRQWRYWSGNAGRDHPIDKVYYAKDCDAYFIIRPISRVIDNVTWVGNHALVHFQYTMRLQPINLFGGRIVNDDENADQEEIEFVPARIDDTEPKYGRVLFLPFSGYDEDTYEGEDESAYPFRYTKSVTTLEAGEKDKKTEYYDRIYIGFWNGVQNYYKKLPHPDVEDIDIMDDWSNFNYLHFSLRINNGMSKRAKIINRIEPKMKTTFKFLSDEIPDVRSVFHIKGKRYICEKITATFTENGMSQLMKGVFYPLAD